MLSVRLLLLRGTVCFASFVVSLQAANAHNIWLEPNTPLVRVGDPVHIAVMLGNHGNAARDYKLASKISPNGLALAVTDARGKSREISPDDLIDHGLEPTEGYWTFTHTSQSSGTTLAAATLDRVMNHGTPVRVRAGAKCYIRFADSLDRPGAAIVPESLGHPLELVPLVDPATEVAVGRPIRLRVLRNGKPSPGMKVTFIPSGVVLQGEVDARHEPTSDGEGVVSFTPEQAVPHLIVTKYTATDESGDDYKQTAYAATLTIAVPNRPFSSTDTAAKP